MDKPDKNDKNCQARPINTNFEEIFYQSPIGILLYDKDGKLTNANDSALDIARIQELDDVMGTNIFDNPKLASKKNELHEKGLIKFQDTLDLIQIKEQNIYNPINPKIIDIDWTVSVTDSGYLIQIQDITQQKFVEDSLKESESTLRSFFDATGDMRGIIDVVSDNDIMHIADNIVTAGYVGTTPDMMRNKLGSELGEPQEILNRWIKYYKESKRTCKPVSFEYLDERENKKAWLVATVNYIGTNRQGQSRYAYIVRDITERKNSEEALDQSQKLLQDIINGFPSPIFVKDTEGRFLIINNRLEDLLGVKSEDLKGKTDYDIITSELADYYRANDQRVLEERKTIRIEEEADLIDGHHTFIANKFPIYDGEGKPYGVGSVSTDITERKKTENLLRFNEERFRLVNENMHEGLMIFDDKGNVTYRIQNLCAYMDS